MNNKIKSFIIEHKIIEGILGFLIAAVIFGFLVFIADKEVIPDGSIPVYAQSNIEKIETDINCSYAFTSGQPVTVKIVDVRFSKESSKSHIMLVFDTNTTAPRTRHYLTVSSLEKVYTEAAKCAPGDTVTITVTKNEDGTITKYLKPLH